MALTAIKGTRGVPGRPRNRCVVPKARSQRARPFRSTSVRCQAVDDGATGAASVPPTTSAEPAAAVEPVAKAEVRLATQAQASDEVAETMPEEQLVMQSIPEPVPSSGGGLAARAIGVGKWVAAAMLAYSIVTTGIRLWKQQTDPRARRMRNVNKNLLLVTQLSEMLPENRAALSKSKVSLIRMKTGFTPVEMFRKYLWFVLRERQFDQDALEDLVALKGALDLTDAQMADALRERAVRIERKYGKVMLNTTGMSEAGVERKATARALFSKLLFLTSCDRILPQGSEEAKSVNLRDIFGATEEETEKLRIVSLHEVDLEKLASMPSTGAAESDEAEVEQRKDP